ncbi:MAG: Peroxiredoxin [Chloroflexi bacterium]|jgi:cytochrome oxidase Cu insertion factor (SCO1/SenC/PrrC family)|nr:MAG: Peroxiredoxin [Chloroflexota bacterium]
MVKQETRTETEFLGRPYNFADWRPTAEERVYFQMEGVKVGQMAPDFTLPTLDGTDITLSALRGKPIMLEFGSIT